MGSKDVLCCSVFLDTQYPGAKEVVDPDGLLGQSDIARLPSIHTRLSELEFLRGLRALEVQPTADKGAGQERERAPDMGQEHEGHADQHAQQDESRLTAELLRMLSAEHMSASVQNTAAPAFTSKGSSEQMSASLEHVTPGGSLGKFRRKTRHAQAARHTAPDSAQMLDEFGAGPGPKSIAQDYPVASQLTPLSSSLSQETGPRLVKQPPPKRAKRKRVRRSEDEDPAWQPEEASSDLAVDPERAALTTERQNASASPAKSTAQGAAPQHIPKSRYKGVSCHKCASCVMLSLHHAQPCVSLSALSRQLAAGKLCMCPSGSLYVPQFPSSPASLMSNEIYAGKVSPHVRRV